MRAWGRQESQRVGEMEDAGDHRGWEEGEVRHFFPDPLLYGSGLPLLGAEDDSLWALVTLFPPLYPWKLGLPIVANLWDPQHLLLVLLPCSHLWKQSLH